MTDIDPAADIEFRSADGHVTVRVPLTGLVTSEWLGCYQQLARATGVPAQAQAHRDRAWIVVRVPADGDDGEVVAALDAARALIAEADAAERPPATAKAEAVAREWWAGRRGSAPDRPIVRTKAAGTVIGAERRWPVVVTLVLAMVLPLLLPARFSLGPRWIVPVIDALLLVAIVVADRSRFDGGSAVGRALSLALVAVLAAEAAGVTIRLVVDLIEGGPETNSAADLLGVGFTVWLYTIIAFAFLYWAFDGGGSEARFLAWPEFPDLAFPAQLNPGVAPPGWRPEFFDYLYLGFTNATAFSPTDVMPIARWAKLAMTVQAVGSIAILGLVISRAINILK
jgi:hypothetical protein